MATQPHRRLSRLAWRLGIPLWTGGGRRSALRQRAESGAGAAPRHRRPRRSLYRRPAQREVAAGAHAKLLRALQQRARGDWALIATEQHPWASATFVGTRHRIVATLGERVEAAFLDGIEEAELRLPGHVLIDLTVAERHGGTLTLEALTIEDC